jgi:hypothetical protein
VRRRYVLYVFELSDAVGRRRRVPSRRSSKPYVYVGYTSKTRRARLAEHGEGRYSGDRKWAPHYVRARADLWNGWPRVDTLDDALDGERDLADALNARGFTVVNKTGERLNLPATNPSRPTTA